MPDECGPEEELAVLEWQCVLGFLANNIFLLFDGIS